MDAEALARALAALLREKEDRDLAEILRGLPDDRLAELGAEVYQRSNGAAPAPAASTNGAPLGRGLPSRIYALIVSAGEDGLGKSEIMSRTGKSEGLVGHAIQRLKAKGRVRLEGTRASARWIAVKGEA